MLAQLRQSARGLLRQPGFALLAVLTLAIGIGASTTLFALLDAVVLRDLPLTRPDELVELHELNPSGEALPVSFGDYRRLREGSRFLRDLAVATWWRGNALIPTGTEELWTAKVSASLFSTLDIIPVLGRAFDKSDEISGRNTVLIISDKLWRRAFKADARILGQSIRLDDRTGTIVGVLPPAVTLPWTLQGADLFLPFAVTPELDLKMHSLHAVGRLNSGVGSDRGQLELSKLLEAGSDADPLLKGWKARLIPLKESLVATIRPALAASFAAVLSVLLIACTNVALLLLVRGSTQSRELAIRAALGASHRRLVVAQLADGLLLATTGGVLGLLVASVAIEAIVALAPPGVPRLHEVHLDATAACFAIGVTILSGLLASLAPALRLSHSALYPLLADGGSGSTTGAGKLRARDGLVAAQISLALILAISTGLLLKSMYRVLSAPLGFEPATKSIVDVGFAGDPPSARAVFLAGQMLDRSRSLSGVTEVASIYFPPLVFGRGWRESVQVAGRPAPPPERPDFTMLNWCSPGYFGTLGIKSLRGRDFDSTDSIDSAPVAIVNQAFVRHYFAGMDPIGQLITPNLTFPSGRPPRARQIIGVVADVHQWALEKEVLPELYMPQLQEGTPSTTLVISSTRPAGELQAQIRAALESIDPKGSISPVRSYQQLLDLQLASRRFQLKLIVPFAVLSMALAALGVFGVMSYAAAQRRREMALRLALGAQPGQVAALILRRALAISLMGSAIGIALSLGATRLMQASLYDVESHDPLIFAAGAVCLNLLVLLVTIHPAWTVMRINAVSVLRGE